MSNPTHTVARRALAGFTIVIAALSAGCADEANAPNDAPESASDVGVGADVAPGGDADRSAGRTPRGADDGTRVPPEPLDAPPTCSPVEAPAFDVSPLEQRFVEVAAQRGISGVQTVIPDNYGDTICGHAIVLTGGAAIEDYDDDGDLDIFVARIALPDQLWQNDGDGSFTDVAPDLGLDTVGSSNTPAWVDIDGDGDLDLYVQTLGEDPNLMWVQTADGWVDEAAPRGLAMNSGFHRDEDGCANLFGATFADIDADGDLDLTTARWLPVGTHWGVRRFDNDGTGVFTDVTETLGPLPDWQVNAFGVTWADFDGDHDLDPWITADFETSGLFLNEGDGFVDVTEDAFVGTDENGMGTSVADFDGDGDLDVFITSVHGEGGDECSLNWGCSGNRLFVNDGWGRFADCTDTYGVREGNWGWGGVWFDADLDGDVDLAQTAGYDIEWEAPELAPFHDGVTRYRDGATRFWRAGAQLPWVDSSVDVGFEHPGRGGRALVPFDLEGDGDIDMFLTHSAEEPTLFENRGAEGRAWLRVRLRDTTTPNTRGVGATVHLRATEDGPWFRRDIRAGGDTYISTRPFEAHFGLGERDAPVDTVQVVWPDGEATVVHDVDPSTVLTITRDAQ